jgi:hypothetical protein
MSVATIDTIVTEILAKRPELASEAEAVRESVEMFGSLGEMLLGQVEGFRSQIGEALKTIDLNSVVVEEARKEFAIWGIDPVKFATFFGGTTEEDAWKLVQMTLARDPSTSTWKEALKTFVLARLNPKVDVLVK